MNKLNYSKSSYILSTNGLTLKEWTGNERFIDFTTDSKLIKIEYIDEYAFNNCRNLISIDLPPKVSVLKVGTFCLCTKLKTIILPDNLVRIEEGAFSNCESIENINLPESVEYIDKYAFLGCISLLSFSIPEKVTSIEMSTFKNCYNLKSVVIPEGVTMIKNQAFWNCCSLEKIVIPYSLISIGSFAFIGCKSLIKLIRPDNVVIDNIELKVDELHTFIGGVERGSSEWKYMWSKLAKEPINSKCADPTECLNDSEVYQYMGTYFNDSGEIIHNFRHRYHPVTKGKYCVDINSSKRFLAEVEDKMDYIM